MGKRNEKACWKQEDPFYSYENFMLNHASNAVSSYDGYWLAAYQAEEQNERKCYGNIQIVTTLLN